MKNVKTLVMLLVCNVAILNSSNARPEYVIYPAQSPEVISESDTKKYNASLDDPRIEQLLGMYTHLECFKLNPTHRIAKGEWALIHGPNYAENQRWVLAVCSDPARQGCEFLTKLEQKPEGMYCKFITTDGKFKTFAEQPQTIDDLLQCMQEHLTILARYGNPAIIKLKKWVDDGMQPSILPPIPQTIDALSTQPQVDSPNALPKSSHDEQPGEARASLEETVNVG